MQPLDITAFFASEAEHLANTYRKAAVPHKAKNIVTAGDTVERAVRKFIKERIPNRYYTTHGHIVDQSLSVSGQFDILIADDKGSPTLASYENGMDFLAYES